MFWASHLIFCTIHFTGGFGNVNLKQIPLWLKQNNKNTLGKAIRLFQVFLSMEQSYYRNYLKDEDTKFHGKSRHNNFFVSVHPATDTFAHPANHRLLRRKEFGTFFYPDDLCQAKSYSFVPVRMLQASCRQNGFNVETRGYTCYRLWRNCEFVGELGDDD